MLSLLAAQASVDIDQDGYRTLAWDEVEHVKRVSSGLFALPVFGYQNTSG